MEYKPIDGLIDVDTCLRIVCGVNLLNSDQQVSCLFIKIFHSLPYTDPQQSLNDPTTMQTKRNTNIDIM